MTQLFPYFVGTHVSYQVISYRLSYGSEVSCIGPRPKADDLYSWPRTWNWAYTKSLDNNIILLINYSIYSTYTVKCVGVILVTFLLSYSHLELYGLHLGLYGLHLGLYGFHLGLYRNPCIWLVRSSVSSFTWERSSWEFMKVRPIFDFIYMILFRCMDFCIVQGEIHIVQGEVHLVQGEVHIVQGDYMKVETSQVWHRLISLYKCYILSS